MRHNDDKLWILILTSNLCYQEGLDQASEKTRACKKDTEEEISECLSGFPGYEQCLANPSFEHHRPSNYDSVDLTSLLQYVSGILTKHW